MSFGRSRLEGVFRKQLQGRKIRNKFYMSALLILLQMLLNLRHNLQLSIRGARYMSKKSIACIDLLLLLI